MKFLDTAEERIIGTVQYEVLWEDCDEPLDVDEDEMMSMVKESFYVT